MLELEDDGDEKTRGQSEEGRGQTDAGQVSKSNSKPHVPLLSTVSLVMAKVETASFVFRVENRLMTKEKKHLLMMDISDNLVTDIYKKLEVCDISNVYLHTVEAA